MSEREPIKTTVAEAIAYWSRRVDECELSVDWAEADTHCWRCGCQRDLQRCHIVPDSLDSPDTPSNIVLLCQRCHADGPNVRDPEIMWDWIKAYSVPLYDTFWGIMGAKEYAFLYKKTVEDEIADILEAAGVPEEDVSGKLNQIYRDVMEDASVHFGQPYFNVATAAGIYRMSLKKLAALYGVTFPLPQPSGRNQKPWWA